MALFHKVGIIQVLQWLRCDLYIINFELQNDNRMQAFFWPWLTNEKQKQKKKQISNISKIVIILQLFPFLYTDFCIGLFWINSTIVSI